MAKAESFEVAHRGNKNENTGQKMKPLEKYYKIKVSINMSIVSDLLGSHPRTRREWYTRQVPHKEAIHYSKQYKYLTSLSYVPEVRTVEGYHIL